MDEQKFTTKHEDDIDVQKHDMIVAPDAREAYGPAGQFGVFDMGIWLTTFRHRRYLFKLLCRPLCSFRCHGWPAIRL